MRRLTKEKCGFLISIPMKGTVESLNVSVACGITLLKYLGKDNKCVISLKLEVMKNPANIKLLNIVLEKNSNLAISLDLTRKAECLNSLK